MPRVFQVSGEDRLLRLADTALHYDSSGAVVRNYREDAYQWDARGLLAVVAKPVGGHRVRYHYDHQRRLVARRDQLGNITQFLYGDRRHGHRVTHVYRPRSDQLTTLSYDDAGRPVLLQVDGEQYTVVSDRCGTPRLLYDSGGRLVRQLRHSAYGHPVSNSWPQLYLPVDWCGGLWDASTELLHMSQGRVLDPLVGQWLAPDVDGLLRNLMNPRRLHLYRFNGNDPVNVGNDELAPQGQSRLDLGWGLQKCGQMRAIRYLKFIASIWIAFG